MIEQPPQDWTLRQRIAQYVNDRFAAGPVSVFELPINLLMEVLENGCPPPADLDLRASAFSVGDAVRQEIERALGRPIEGGLSDEEARVVGAGLASHFSAELGAFKLTLGPRELTALGVLFGLLVDSVTKEVGDGR